MRSLNVSFESPVAYEPGVLVDIYWNVNARGIASGDVDTSVKVNDASMELFAGITGGQSHLWLQTAFLSNEWLVPTATPSATFSTPMVHFGDVKLAGKARDYLGNYQAAAIEIGTITVNSTPMPPSNLKVSTYTAGRQWFTFTPSPQLET